MVGEEEVENRVGDLGEGLVVEGEEVDNYFFNNFCLPFIRRELHLK